jgi:hypothetical protein
VRDHTGPVTGLLYLFIFVKTNKTQQQRFLIPTNIFVENLPYDGNLMPKHVAVGT